MQSARDSGKATLSGMVGLVRDQPKNLNTTPPAPTGAKPEQPSNRAPRPGFLLSMPVFHHGRPRANPAERGAALRGWVYMPVRAQDLIDNLPTQVRRPRATISVRSPVMTRP
ncbi:CHASE domain-containing protein [Thiomonas sp.]